MTELSSRQAVIRVEGHQFYLAEMNNDVIGTDPTVYTGGNGLAAARRGYVVILTGMNTGYTTVQLDLHDSAPALDLDWWDDVAEVSVTFTARAVAYGPGEDIPALTPVVPQPGDYRLRVHAQGRDTSAGNHGVGTPHQPADERGRIEASPAGGDHFGRVVIDTSPCASCSSRPRCKAICCR